MTIGEQNKEIALLQKDFEALSIRVNQLERVVNRLSHWCSAAIEGTTIDLDNWDEPAKAPPPVTRHDGKDLRVDTVASRKEMLT